jgi:1-phosphofructokinase family hexose kinase
MIRTITLNTGFDETYTVSDLEYGGVRDVVDYRSEPSGKGINAARVLRGLGVPVHVYGLIGESDRALFSTRLAMDRIDCTLASVPGNTRRNLTLTSVSQAAPAAHCRAAGFSLSDDEAVTQLVDRLAAECRPGDLVSIHGSTPHGLPVDTWTRFARIAQEMQVPLVVDVYGAPLLSVLAGGGVLCCKPNAAEMAVLPAVAGTPGEAGVMAALRFMLRQGVALPTVSLGGRGLWSVIEGRVWSALATIPYPKVLVGAGDACVAGMMAQMMDARSSPRDIIARGVAVAGAHVAGYTGGQLSARSQDMQRSIVFTDQGPLL